MKFFLPNGASVAGHYFRKALNADVNARPEAEKALVAAHKLCIDIDNLEVFSLQKRSAENLRAAKLSFSDYDFAAYDRLGSDGRRAEIRAKLFAQVVAKLGRDTEPIVRRVASGVVAEIAQDLAAAEAIERRCNERFNTAPDISELRAVLSEVSEDMKRKIETPHDLSSHTNPFGLVASWFAKPIDYVAAAGS